MLYLSMKDTEEEQLCAEENCVDKKAHFISILCRSKMDFKG